MQTKTARYIRFAFINYFEFVPGNRINFSGYGYYLTGCFLFLVDHLKYTGMDEGTPKTECSVLSNIQL